MKLSGKEYLCFLMMFILLINRPLCLAFGLPASIMLIIGVAFYFGSLFMNASFRQIALHKAVLIWFVLMIYHFLNAVYCEVPGTDHHVLLNCFQTSILLAFTAYAFVRDENKCMKLLICGYLVFLLLCLKNGYYREDLEDRLSTTGIHTNQIGQCAGIFAIIGTIYYYNSKLKLFLIYAFAIIISLLTQSRNSLGLIAFGLMILLFDILKKQKWYVSVSMTLILVLIGMYLSDYVMDLPLFQRFQENSSDEVVEKFLERNDLTKTNTILDNILGERIIYYYLGWDDFIASPPNGIGLWNFKNLHFDFPIHSEYIVHLAEGGFIGFGLYLLFICFIVKGLCNVKYDKDVRTHYVIAFSAILFVSITARIFMCEFVFPLYGCIIGYGLKNRELFLGGKGYPQVKL